MAAFSVHSSPKHRGAQLPLWRTSSCPSLMEVFMGEEEEEEAGGGKGERRREPSTVGEEDSDSNDSR